MSCEHDLVRRPTKLKPNPFSDRLCNINKMEYMFLFQETLRCRRLLLIACGTSYHSALANQVNHM